MIRKLFLINILFTACLFGQTIETKSSQWNLVGTDSSLTNLTAVDFNNGDALWQYDQSDTQNPWKCYRHGENYITDGICEPITAIEAGSGFWIYSFYDNNITIVTQAVTVEKTISDSWTLFSPVLNDYNVSDIFNDTNISVVWGYDNNWSFADENNTSTTYTALSKLEQNKGYWLYNPTNESQYIGGRSITIGDDTVALSNDGVFGTVQKVKNNYFLGYFDQSTFETCTPTEENKDTCLAEYSVEDIWNISFPVDISRNYEDINLTITSIKYENDGTNDTGDYYYENLSIINGELVLPNKLTIAGVGDTRSGSIVYQNTSTMLQNSLELNDNVLNIKLGYVMKNQSFVSDSSFTQQFKYDLNISFTQPISSNISGTIDIQ